MELRNFFNCIFGIEELKITQRIWEAEKCYLCGGDYDKNNFWARFEEINGETYQVPICNDCSGPSVLRDPSDSPRSKEEY